MRIATLPLLFLPHALAPSQGSAPTAADPRIASVTVTPSSATITLHWKRTGGERFGSIAALKDHLTAQGRTPTVIMNGGMYMEDRTPLGLYVENGKVLRKLNTRQKAEGNFYLQPNGVFGIAQDGRAFICTSTAYAQQKDVRYATQSGPMLLIDGLINTQFTPGSANLNIRNGVGLRPDGRLVFAISREAVNFHDFASFFLKEGCTNALYLDGFVSRAFLPAAGVEHLGGDFGVMIAVTSR